MLNRNTRCFESFSACVFRVRNARGMILLTENFSMSLTKSLDFQMIHTCGRGLRCTVEEKKLVLAEAEIYCSSVAVCPQHAEFEFY